MSKRDWTRRAGQCQSGTIQDLLIRGSGGSAYEFRNGFRARRRLG